MSNLGDSYAIACAIYTRGKNYLLEDKSEVLYDYMQAMDKPDEWLADVYAQLEEKLTADTAFPMAVTIICDAMRSADERFIRG